MGRVLVVDDEPGVRTLLEVMLRRDGHEVTIAEDGLQAVAVLEADPHIEVVLSDLRMDGLDGLGLLEAHRRLGHHAFVIIMTAFAEWTTAVQAMRLGAYTFLRKPFDNALARSVVARALAARDRHLAASEAGEHQAGAHMVGSSIAIQEVQRLIEQVSTTDSTVLVTGESGTGKELVARAIHYSSLRADGPIVRVNAGSLAPNLQESELFGHVKGAFAGALTERQGLFALAEGGTLFLDEVGELAPDTQAKLLRVLETGEYSPVGGHDVHRADVRVVAATNRDLPAMVKAGTFREDLYYRLGVIPIFLPPLRERRDDVPLLAGHLLSRHAVKLRRGVTGFSADAIQALLAHHWPGNIRELDNRVQRGVTLVGSGDITRELLFGDLDIQPLPKAGDDALIARITSGQTIDLDRAVAHYERALIQAALTQTDNNLTEAAKLLGVSFRQIRYKVRQLGLR